MEKTINAAVIGLGGIGRHHARSWAAIDGANLVAASDPVSASWEKCREETGTESFFEDYREMIDKVKPDAVSVCVPTGMHAEVANTCLEAGVHVLCEKPPANSVEEARSMHMAAQRCGKKLGFALQRRYEIRVMEARKAVEENLLGNVYHGRAAWVRSLARSPMKAAPDQSGQPMPWRMDGARGGGTLLDLGVHLLDVAWFVMGCPAPVSVYGRMTSAMIPVLARSRGMKTPEVLADDCVTAIIQFENGCSLMLESSFALWRDPDSPEVYCDLSGTSGGLKIYPDKPLLLRPEATTELAFDPPESEVRERMCGDFCDAIINDRRPLVDGAQAVTLMTILEAVGKSSKTGQTVHLND